MIGDINGNLTEEINVTKEFLKRFYKQTKKV